MRKAGQRGEPSCEKPARGQYGKFLGCSEPECQTAWDANGWRFEGKRELYDHGNSGLPDQFIPVRHPGHWEHHELAVWTGGGKHDFTPDRKPEIVVEETGVWAQLMGLVRGESARWAEWEMAA